MEDMAVARSGDRQIERQPGEALGITLRNRRTSGIPRVQVRKFRAQNRGLNLIET